MTDAVLGGVVTGLMALAFAVVIGFVVLYLVIKAAVRAAIREAIRPPYSWTEQDRARAVGEQLRAARMGGAQRDARMIP